MVFCMSQLFGTTLLCQTFPAISRGSRAIRKKGGTTWFCSLCHGLCNRAGAPMVVEKKPAQQSCAKVSSFDNPPFSSVRRFLRRAIFVGVSAHLWRKTASDKPLTCNYMTFAIAFRHFMLYNIHIFAT